MRVCTNKQYDLILKIVLCKRRPHETNPKKLCSRLLHYVVEIYSFVTRFSSFALLLRDKYMRKAINMRLLPNLLSSIVLNTAINYNYDIMTIFLKFFRILEFSCFGHKSTIIPNIFG